MKCHRCGSGRLIRQETDLPFKLDHHQVLIVKDTPCHICDGCGEIIMDDRVMREIERLSAAARAAKTELEIVRYAA